MAVARITGGRTLTAIAGLWLCAAETPAAVGEATVRGSVPADWPVGLTAPVAVPLPDGIGPGWSGLVELAIGDTDQRQRLPAQVEPADPATGTPARAWVLWTAPPEAAGRGIAVRFGPSAESPSTQPTGIARYENPLVHVKSSSGSLLLSYWHGEPAKGGKYPLTSFIHPLIGLDGEVLTVVSPEDHPHHRGIFWAWVRHELDGRSIGNWWIPEQTRLEPGPLEVAPAGPVFSAFKARHTWVWQVSPEAPAKRIIEETLVCRVFADLPAGRAIDLDLTLAALCEGVRIGGQTALNKGYGGMTLRFGKARDIRIVADGRDLQTDHNRLKAHWVDWTGFFDAPGGGTLPGRSGAALMVHSSHPPLPAEAPEWITRFYGPINPAYPGLAMLEIPPDKPLHLRYRVWVHRGDAHEGHVARQHRAYTADWKWALP